MKPSAWAMSRARERSRSSESCDPYQQALELLPAENADNAPQIHFSITDEDHGKWAPYRQDCSDK